MNENELEVKYGKDFFKNIKNVSKCEPDVIKDIRSTIIDHYKPIFKIQEEGIQNIVNKYKCFKTIKTSITYNKDVHIGYFVQDGIIHMPWFMPFLEHEVAHFVEMNDLTRLLKDDFGFDTMFYHYYNHKIIGSINYKRVISSSIRETRVRAIHYIIKCSFTKDKDNFIKKFKYNYSAGLTLFSGNNLNINFGRFKSNKEFEEYLLHTAERTFDIYNKEKILFEFDNRIKYVLENSK